MRVGMCINICINICVGLCIDMVPRYASTSPAGPVPRECRAR